MEHYYLIKLHYFDVLAQKWSDDIHFEVCFPTHIKRRFNDYVVCFSGLRGIKSVTGECYEVTDLEKIF